MFGTATGVRYTSAIQIHIYTDLHKENVKLTRISLYSVIVDGILRLDISHKTCNITGLVYGLLVRDR